MKVGDLLKVNIIDENHLGNGITKYEDVTVFVPQTIKGDTVKVEITDIHKKVANSRVVSFYSKSKNRCDVKCPYYDKCGGCNLLHVSYEKENELKSKYIKKLFKGFDIDIISFDREHYRNKVTLHVSNNCIGFYNNKSNELISINECLLINNDINMLIKELEKIDLSSVNDIVIKKANEGLLLSVVGNIHSKDIEKLKKIDLVKSIYINDKLVHGDKYLTINFGNIIYNINNNSFFQINNSCAKALYEVVKEEIGKCDGLLDLYCGTGSIGIYLSDNVKSITGIEINKDSVECAKKNILDNNIKNYEIINADASYIENDYDVVVVDPPRAGLSKEVISILNEMNNKKLIYISCNPSTLKRDIDLLSDYKINKIKAFNMFPGTKHIETLVVLEKKGD